MKHFIEDGTGQEEEIPSENFFRELELLLKKYGLSISHEDWNGSFVIEKYDTGNTDWLRGAMFTSEAADIVRKAERNKIAQNKFGP